MFSFLFLFIETMLPTMAPHLTMYFLSTTRAGVMLAIMSRSINSFYHMISKLKPVAGSASLWCWSKARRLVPSLNTECLQNSAKSGERSVLTLAFFCLLCYMKLFPCKCNDSTKGRLIIIRKSLNLGIVLPVIWLVPVPVSFLFRDCTRKLFSYKLDFLLIINLL